MNKYKVTFTKRVQVGIFGRTKLIESYRYIYAIDEEQAESIFKFSTRKNSKDNLTILSITQVKQ